MIKIKEIGFTIIELLIACVIISVGLLSVISMIISTFNKTVPLSDNLTASYLAQEGFEIIRRIRDTNFNLKWQSFHCGDVFVDPRDGQSYKTVQIGDQCWMAENMNYDNGCYTLNDTTWTDGTYSSCRHNEEAGSEEESRATYGLLYQWSAAMDDSTTERAQGICPTGWHLPTDEEWKTLEMELGMTEAEADDTNWRGSPVGGMLKEAGTDHWDSPNECGTATCNSSGFTALPAGYVLTAGTSDAVGSFTLFWSSTEFSATRAWRRGLSPVYADVHRYTNDKAYGYSVRCLKDEMIEGEKHWLAGLMDEENWDPVSGSVYYGSTELGSKEDQYLKINPDGFYNYDLGNETIFKRKITLTRDCYTGYLDDYSSEDDVCTEGAEYILVEILVTWNKTGRPEDIHQYEAATKLFNWY